MTSMGQATEETSRTGYVRDRSFYQSRPSGAHTPKIHLESDAQPGMAACDGRFILLDIDRPIALVDGDAQQKSRLCRRCFPK